MAPYGPIWARMASYGTMWPHMASYCTMWLHIAPHGTILPYPGMGDNGSEARLQVAGKDPNQSANGKPVFFIANLK